MKNKRGLTLIEVVVAMAVFMILVTMVFPILTQSGLMNVQSRHKLNAQEIGVLVVEELLHEAKIQGSLENLQYHITENDLESLETQFSSSYEINNADYSVKLEFSDTDNLVKVIVKSDRQVFETVEWLRYD